MTTEPRPTWIQFTCWAVVGLLMAGGILSILTIGIVPLLVGSGLAGLLALRRLVAGGVMFGAGVGAALPIAWIGWLNRHGPDTYCHPLGSGTECTTEWSPWPFFAATVVLVMGAIVLYRRRSAAYSHQD